MSSYVPGERMPVADAHTNPSDLNPAQVDSGAESRLCSSGNRIRRGVAVFFFTLKKRTSPVSLEINYASPEFFYIFVNAVGFLYTRRVRSRRRRTACEYRVYIMVTVRGYMRLIDRDPTGVYRTRARV